MTREVIAVRRDANGWVVLRGSHTSVGCNLVVFASKEIPETVCVYRKAHKSVDVDFHYVSNRNCLALVQANAPISVIIDALLETDDNEWSCRSGDHRSGDGDRIALTRQCIEAVAVMDLIPSEQS